ncbi:MAG TPA: LuxR family transcriptional regulator [Rhizomicrobium sp.]|nr:LuxR family transcriptional regulator [Rhizomicrobium sp.]
MKPAQGLVICGRIFVLKLNRTTRLQLNPLCPILTASLHTRNRGSAMGQFQDVQEFIRLARSAGTLADLRSLLEGTTKSFGFTYFMLGHHVNVIRGSLAHLSNYPIGFAEAMSKRRRFSDDPVMRACQTKTASFRWSELSSLIPLSPYQAEVLTNAERAGIGEGFTVPASIPGECLGSCSFAVRTGQAFDERILPAVQYVGSFAFEAARRLAQADALTRDIAGGVPALSPRQLDCLVLIAQGKSDVDTAQLLGLSKSTVHEYVENAKRKYGVASRVQLIIRTLFDNQLGFDDIIRH